MKKKNPLAQALGKLGRGHAKTLTDEQREAKRERMKKLNEARALAVK